MLASAVLLMWSLFSGVAPPCHTGNTLPTLQILLHTSTAGGLVKLKRANGTTFQCELPSAVGVPDLSIELEPSFAAFAYEGVVEVRHLNHDVIVLPVVAGRAVVVEPPFPIETDVIVFVALVVVFLAWVLTRMWRAKAMIRLASSALLLVVSFWAATVTRVLHNGHTHCGGSLIAALMPLVVLMAIVIHVHSERALARPLACMAWVLSLAFVPCGGWLPTRLTELQHAQERLYGHFFLVSTLLGFCFIVLPRFSKGADVRKRAGIVLAIYFCVVVATALFEVHYRSYLADSCGG